jgi:hypothetical protein
MDHIAAYFAVLLGKPPIVVFNENVYSKEVFEAVR